jgi:hypothetical protein
VALAGKLDAAARHSAEAQRAGSKRNLQRDLARAAAEVDNDIAVAQR